MIVPEQSGPRHGGLTCCRAPQRSQNSLSGRRRSGRQRWRLHLNCLTSLRTHLSIVSLFLPAGAFWLETLELLAFGEKISFREGSGLLTAWLGGALRRPLFVNRTGSDGLRCLSRFFRRPACLEFRPLSTG